MGDLWEQHLWHRLGGAALVVEGGVALYVWSLAGVRAFVSGASEGLFATGVVGYGLAVVVPTSVAVVGFRVYRGQYGAGGLLVGGSYAAAVWYLTYALYPAVPRNSFPGGPFPGAVAAAAWVWIPVATAGALVVGRRRDGSPRPGSLGPVGRALWVLGCGPSLAVGVGVTGAMLTFVAADTVLPALWLLLDPLGTLPVEVLLVLPVLVPWLLGAAYVGYARRNVRGSFRTLLDQRRATHATDDAVAADTVVGRVGSIERLELPRRRVATHVVVADNTVHLVEDVQFDPATRRVGFGVDRREIPTDMIEAVDYEGQQVVIRTADGRTHAVCAAEDPTEVLSAIEDRTGRSVLGGESRDTNGGDSPDAGTAAAGDR